MTENSIENEKNSNKKNEKIIKIEKISNENSQNSNEKIENFDIKSEKNSQNLIESEKISKESEKIPYYKRYYQKHKEEIKSKRLEKLKKAQEKQLETVDVNENKLKPIEKVKVTAWQWTTEAILAIFILSLIAGIIVYKWWTKRNLNEGGE